LFDPFHSSWKSLIELRADGTVTAFSASYSTKSGGAPTPAVTPGSKAATVAA